MLTQRKMGRSWTWWFFIVSSVLGIYFGITIFFVFSFYYGNTHAGTWGLFSAMFAAICLHLKLLHSNNRLQNWYTAGHLTATAASAFICFCISLGFTSWYIIYSSYHHIPIMPVRTSFILAAVWAGMCAKWSFTVFILSYRYARLIRYSTPFLITQENA